MVMESPSYTGPLGMVMQMLVLLQHSLFAVVLRSRRLRVGDG